MTLVTRTPDDERQLALLRAVGFDKLNEAQRELALAIANRYDLDPMLRHLVMIEGKPYITRDGLLHVAHKSKQLDGIEVTDPVKTDDGKHWTVKASVYRKDMSRPFAYSGRYPVDGKNRVFAPEMAVKVAEVMALRRAFDVAAPVIEERWDVDDATVAPAAEPVSLADKIAQRAESIQVAPQPEEPTETAGPVEAFLDTVDALNRVTEAVLVAPMEVAESAALPVEPDDEPVKDSVGITKDEFATRIAGMDRNEVKAVAKKLYPDVTKFADLDGYQLETLALMLEMGATDADDKGHKTKTHRAGTRESW